MTASVDQVARLLGRPISDPDEQHQVEAWIDYADRLAHRLRPTIDQAISDGTLKQDDVDMAEAMAVARFARNPAGNTSETWRVDDTTHTVGTTNSKDGIYFTDEELDMLTPDSDVAGNAFTITPSPMADPYRQMGWNGS